MVEALYTLFFSVLGKGLVDM